nr:hypothetical protein [Chloroflexota bacterium]
MADSHDRFASAEGIAGVLRADRMLAAMIAIDRAALIDDLVGLVRIPSITGAEEAVAADA